MRENFQIRMKVKVTVQWGAGFCVRQHFQIQTPVSFAATPFEKGAFIGPFSKGLPRSGWGLAAVAPLYCVL
jgi:hypothetical protein